MPIRGPPLPLSSKGQASSAQSSFKRKPMHSDPAKLVPGAPSVPKLPDPAISARPLKYFLRLLRARLPMMTAVTFFLTASVVSLCALLPQINKASAKIAVDRQTRPESVGDNLLLNTGDDQFMATQLSLIQQDNVLRPVAQRFDLWQREHQLNRFFFWKYPPAREEDIRQAPVYLRNLKVSREPNTYVLTITYKDRDPVIAAGVANTVANSYLDQIHRMRSAEGSRLASSMKLQLQGLKKKMETSNAAVLQYEKELGAADPDQKAGILLAKLQALNAEYAAAEGDRINKQSILQAEQAGQLTSSQDRDLQRDLEAVNAARSNLAAVATTFGDRHPEYLKASALLTDAQETLAADREKTVHRAGIDYHQSSAEERLLSSAVAATKREVDSLTARSFEYRRLKYEAETNQRVYDELFAKIDQAGINSELDNAVIRLADKARPPAKPVFPNWLLIVPACLLVFSSSSAGWVIWRDLMDDSARDPGTVELASGVSVLCCLPDLRRRALQTHLGLPVLLSNGPVNLQAGLFQERVRQMRRYLLSSPETLGCKTLLVTSAMPSEGKSTVALSLAVAQAEQGLRTLLIDADLRQSTLEKMTRLERQPGLSDFLSGDESLERYYRRVPGKGELYLIGSGTSLPLPLPLLSAKIRDILRTASETFDSIILDSPPMLGCAETSDLAVATDATLLTARSGRTSMSSLKTAVTSLLRLDVCIAGIVLNQSAGLDDGVYKDYRRYYTAAPTA
jgi:polysaccharide biosynthesis transport protein